MTQAKWQKTNDALSGWLSDLRKELTDIREKAATMDGLEPLKLRVEAVEAEAKLMETFVSLMTKPLEAMAKLSTS